MRTETAVRRAIAPRPTTALNHEDTKVTKNGQAKSERLEIAATSCPWCLRVFVVQSFAFVPAPNLEAQVGDGDELVTVLVVCSSCLNAWRMFSL